MVDSTFSSLFNQLTSYPTHPPPLASMHLSSLLLLLLLSHHHYTNTNNYPPVPHPQHITIGQGISIPTLSHHITPLGKSFQLPSTQPSYGNSITVGISICIHRTLSNQTIYQTRHFLSLPRGCYCSIHSRHQERYL